MRNLISLCFIVVLGASARAQLVLPFMGTDSGATVSAFQIIKSGTSGRANTLYITNSSNTSDVLLVNTVGTGRAGYFSINNSASTQPALRADSNGAGMGVFGFMTGTGRAGSFRITNAANTSNALHAQTNGSGAALLAQAGTGMAAHFMGRIHVEGGAPSISVETSIANANAIMAASTSSTGNGIGVMGSTNAPFGWGMVGIHTPVAGSGSGVFGSSNSPNGFGVTGQGNAASGGAGVYGLSLNPTGIGVLAYNFSTTGPARAVFAETKSSDGIAVFGFASSTSGLAYGVRGENRTSSGAGVSGAAQASSGTGVFGHSSGAAGSGVYGEAPSTNTATVGVMGRSYSPTGFGILGINQATTGTAYGIRGITQSTAGYAVYGHAFGATGNTFGVAGGATSANGFGVYAFGKMGASGTKSFRIDHPFNPENEYLLHYCGEGPEPLNTYSGNVKTDAKGEAWVQLPDYFAEINRDFRYSLTTVDDGESEDFVLAKVATRIRDNKFRIRTSKPFVSVSWRVDAVRNDRWVRKYGAPVEVEKTGSEKGKYQNPELFDQPATMGIHPATPLQKEASKPVMK